MSEVNVRKNGSEKAEKENEWRKLETKEVEKGKLKERKGAGCASA